MGGGGCEMDGKSKADKITSKFHNENTDSEINKLKRSKQDVENSFKSKYLI